MPTKARRVWLKTCTCTLRLVLSDTCASTSDVTCNLFLFFILFYLFIIFKLNRSTFYNSSQVVKTRKKKLNYNVTCSRILHFSLPATSLAIDTNRACCQWRQDTVVVKRLKLISTIMHRVLEFICRRKRHDPQISGHRTTEYECNAQSLCIAYVYRVFLPHRKTRHNVA